MIDCPTETSSTIPLVMRRQCGGWLAVSRPGSDFSIGVEGDTEEMARDAFAVAIAAWMRLREERVESMEARKG